MIDQPIRTGHEPEDRPARDLSGHPGQAKLRAAWGVSEGGRRRSPAAKQVKGDIEGNMGRTLVTRAAKRRAELEDIADDVYADYTAGMTHQAIQTKYRCVIYSLHPIWRARGYAYEQRQMRIPA